MKSEESLKIEIPKEEVFDANFGCSTYPAFIFLSKRNYLIFPLAVLFFIIDEAFTLIYFRLLAGYDQLLEGEHDIFGGNDRLYWLVLGICLLFYFLMYNAKYFFLSFFVLNSTERLHEEMLHSLVRSPCAFFDVVPTGELASKFSNDLGILDEILGFVAFDVVEQTIFILIMFGNVFQIDLYFIIPGSIHILFVLVVMWFSKKTIVVLKEVDLKLKGPVFSMANEMLGSLTQIKVFERRLTLLREFVERVNNSMKGNVTFWEVNRVFSVYISYFSILVILVGFIIGITNILSRGREQVGLYFITVVFFVFFNEIINFNMRQIVYLESIMVSAERSLRMVGLPHEA